MNHNLTAVALTIMTLGIIAIFNIIPGAGFYAGAIMLACGGAILLGQFVTREGPFLSPAGWTRLPNAPVQFRAQEVILPETERRPS